MSYCNSEECSTPFTSTSSLAPKTTELSAATALYRINNMDCPTEEKLIRDKLSKLDNVTGMDFNLIQRTLLVRHQMQSLAPIEEALSSIDMRAVRLDGFEAEEL